MRKSKPITISLKPETLRVLDGASLKWGSRSEVVRVLLEEYAERDRRSAMDRAYREYFSDADASRRELTLGDELRMAATWPDERSQVHERRRRKAR